jgi:hypothetical protein
MVVMEIRKCSNYKQDIVAGNKLDIAKIDSLG